MFPYSYLFAAYGALRKTHMYSCTWSWVRFAGIQGPYIPQKRLGSFPEQGISLHRAQITTAGVAGQNIQKQNFRFSAYYAWE